MEATVSINMSYSVSLYAVEIAFTLAKLFTL